MRKITRELVLLLAVFVIYFGYSAWIDGTALYRVMDIIQGTDHLTQIMVDPKTGAIGTGVIVKLGDFVNTGVMKTLFHDGGFISGWSTHGDIKINITGVMANDSLLYTVLAPFKLVLVGGVFALLIPLTKTIFFGTVIGIKDYMKARRSNVLFNYQATIAFATTMKEKLESGDYDAIKAQYAAFGGLAFKPRFLTIMMEEIGQSLLREQDMSVFIDPSQVVIDSVKEMYEKERKLAVAGRPTEMFFDLKRGFEYISIGSKYSIAYFKEVDTGAQTPNQLGWKLFSLEMFKFYLAMLAAIIPTIIVAVIILPIVSKYTNVGGETAPALIFGSFMLFAIAIHATMVFTNSQYRASWKTLIAPAITYYVALLATSLTFAVGLNGVIAIGSMIEPGSVTKMWPWFSAVANLVLTTTLMMYVISTMMDGLTSPRGLSNKLKVDGIVLPLIAWTFGMVLNLLGAFGWDVDTNSALVGKLTGSAFAVALGFWIYLSISGVLLNNIVIPSRKQKLALQAELAQEGKEAMDKKTKASK